MKNINLYITEQLNNKGRQISEILYNMFNGSKLLRENIEIMLNNLDMNILHQFEIYIKEVDSENAFPHLVQDDEFLKEENKSKITSLLSDYLFKFVANVEK